RKQQRSSKKKKATTEMRQEPDENEATGTCASETNSASDPHFLPVNAAKLTQSLIRLSDEQRQVLEKELNRTDEDPLLVLRFNPNWQVKLPSVQFVTR
ncbi:TPA: hypothetical protein N0F65_009866, partial [Lagenidium giganteum]